MDCPICYKKINKSTFNLECNHKFHIKCLLEWKYICQKNYTKFNCPMCRKKWNNIRCLSVEKSVENDQGRGSMQQTQPLCFCEKKSTLSNLRGIWPPECQRELSSEASFNDSSPVVVAAQLRPESQTGQTVCRGRRSRKQRANLFHQRVLPASVFQTSNRNGIEADERLSRWSSGGAEKEWPQRGFTRDTPTRDRISRQIRISGAHGSLFSVDQLQWVRLRGVGW